MATVLRGIGAGMRGRCRYWLRQVEAFVLAVLLAMLLSVPTVHAQTVDSYGISYTTKSTGPSTSSVSGNNLVIAAAAGGLSLAFVLAGGPAATMALTARAVTVAGSVVGPIAANMLRAAVARGPLTGAMLALAAALGSDSSYDASSNSFLSAPAVPATGTKQVRWIYQSGTGTYDDPTQACKDWFAYYNAHSAGGGIFDSVHVVSGNLQCWGHFGAGSSSNFFQLEILGTCIAGYSGTNCATYTGTKPASTDAQLSSAAQAPAALAKVWDAGGCGAKITTYRDTVDPSDPCAQIVNSPSGTWTPVSLPNGGYIAFPGKTDTVTDSTGKVTQTTTTTPTAQVTANTNQATMAQSPVIVQTGGVVKTTTNNADGTQTTTTTTTTNPATTTDQPQDGTVPFNAGTQDLYTKKSRTWAQVLADFQTRLQQGPWYQAATNFFNVSISGGSCPHWTVGATKWTPALDAGTYVCSSAMMALYQTGGVVVMIVAAWAAFRMAFL